MPINLYFDTVFANAGDVTSVPDAIQPDGSVSYGQGYGPKYATPLASGGLDIERAKMNQILQDITAALQQLQQHGTPPFITSTMNGGTPYSYSKYDRVLYSGVVYQSLQNANTDTPPSAKWQVSDLSSNVPVGQCYFQYTSTSVCTLVQKNGSYVTFPSGAVAALSSSGVTITYNNAYINGTPAQTLSANTLYYIYLWNNGTSYVLDASTTAPAVDSTSGIKIKTGDATRVYVGAVRTNGSSQFSDTDGARNVVSYFNPQPKTSKTYFSTQRNTTSTSWIEVNSEIRNGFVNIEGRPVEYSITGAASNNTMNDSVNTAIGFNGTTPENGWTLSVPYTANAPFAIGVGGYKTGLTDGYNYATLLGEVFAGTGQWPAAGSGPKLEITILG